MSNEKEPVARAGGPPEVRVVGQASVVKLLRNHWAPPRGPRAYYWYVELDGSRELQAYAHEAQQAISFAYWDLVAADGLHLTLDRIAIEGELDRRQLLVLTTAAAGALEGVPAFEAEAGGVGMTRSAVGFAVSPVEPFRRLRNVLNAVTVELYPEAKPKGVELHPHITIAYCNSDDVFAGETAVAIETLSSRRGAGFTVTAVSLVLLEKRSDSYAWQVVTKLPLSSR